MSPGQLASYAGTVNSKHGHDKLYADGHKCEHKHADDPTANETFQTSCGLDQTNFPNETVTELY